MDTSSTSSNLKVALNPARLIAGIFFLITGLLSLVNPGIWKSVELFQWLFGQIGFGAAQLDLIQLLLVTFVLPIGSIFLGVSAFLKLRSTFWVFSAVGLFVLTAVVSWIVHYFYPVLLNLGGVYNSYRIFHLSWFESTEWVDWLTLVTLVFATALAVVSKFISFAGSPNPNNSGTIAFSGEATPHYSPASVPSNLPIFALVGSFIFPIVGVILGHISLSQMKRGQIASDNRGLALAGMILGYVFIGLSFIVGIIVTVALIINASRTNYYY